MNLFNRKTLKPVSYTHLDVYKRQRRKLLRLGSDPFGAAILLAYHVQPYVHGRSVRGVAGSFRSCRLGNRCFALLKIRARKSYPVKRHSPLFLGYLL